jgi:signal transduction histidine kinase
LSEKLLALSRPLSFVTMIGLFMTGSDITPNLLGLYAVTAVFFICSSSLVLHWVAVEDRWRHAALYAESIVAAALNFYLYFKNVSGPFEILFLPLIITDTLYRSKTAWVTAAGWILVSVVQLAGAPGKDAFLGVMVNSTLLLFGGSAGAIIRANRESKERAEILLRQVTESQEALQRAHRQLQETAGRQLEAAALEERQRLAREIHDGLAHSLTSLIVHLQVGNRLLSKDPEQAASVIGQCESMARDALRETRLAVRALRSADLAGKSEYQVLKGLGDDFERVTGVRVTVAADTADRKSVV